MRSLIYRCSSCYLTLTFNKITDTPHILSGETLVIFDPHEEFSPPHDGGLEIDFVTEGHMYSDQLAAFKAAVADTSNFYQGTVVRLPLRTARQAARSKIKVIITFLCEFSELISFKKPKEVTVLEIQSLFRELANKELDVVGLFLKSIASIELLEILQNGREVLVGKIKIEDISGLAGSRSFARGSEAREETFRCRISGFNGSSISSTWRIFHSVLDSKETSRIMSKRLPTHSDIGVRLKNDKLFSHVALAFPLEGTPVKGRLFTLLPLPIYTDFPMHLHGILALTPDRQSLRNKEETGISPDSREK